VEGDKKKSAREWRKEREGGGEGEGERELEAEEGLYEVVRRHS